MSKSIGFLYHPTNNHPVSIFKGFSWPCLLFGIFWYAYKGMWKWFIISLLLVLITSGIAWLVLPFFANSQHIKTLKDDGYLDNKSSNYSVKNKSIKSDNDNLDKLKKLGDLKEKGILTEDEFENKKKELLSNI